MQLLFDRRPSPVGEILLAWDEEGRLRALDFHDYEERMHRLLRRHYGDCALRAAALPSDIGEPLAAYFEGEPGRLDAIPTATGGTDFQRRLWAALREIPSGSTTSYGRLAERLGRPGASRAVGLANGANPIAIVVPCHRVIGADGSLTGYGGGLARKQWLIEHERRAANGAG